MSSDSPSLSGRSCSEEGLDDERKIDAMSSASTGRQSQASQIIDDSDTKDPRARLEELRNHPFFGDLQITLALDCLQSTIPYCLLSESCSPPRSPTKSSSKSDPAFCTVSDKIVDEHSKIQMMLLNVGLYHPNLLSSYLKMTDQLESQRYKALTYNCYSDHIKYLINWFYDCERQMLINRAKCVVNSLTADTASFLPEAVKMNIGFLNNMFAAGDVPVAAAAATLPPVPADVEPEVPLDLSGPQTKHSSRIQSTEKKSRFLSKKAVAILQHWYQQHRDHPYATDEEVKELATAGGIAPNQVKKWMANTRARSYNTLTYNGGKHMLNSKLAMKKRLLHKYRIEPPNTSNSGAFYDIAASTLKNKLATSTPCQGEESKEEHIDVETVCRQSPDLGSTEASEAVDDLRQSSNDKTLSDDTQGVTKPSLEQVIARCRLKSNENVIESKEHNLACKSAIESLKDVVNNVSVVSPPESTVNVSLELNGNADRQHQSPPISKRYLSPQAKSILSEWFRKHLYRPYPTYEEKKELATLCDISSSKVDTWFANKRNRTHNTKKLPPKYSHLLKYTGRK